MLIIAHYVGFPLTRDSLYNGIAPYKGFSFLTFEHYLERQIKGHSKTNPARTRYMLSWFQTCFVHIHAAPAAFQAPALQLCMPSVPRGPWQRKPPQKKTRGGILTASLLVWGPSANRSAAAQRQPSSACWHHRCQAGSGFG